MPKKYDSLSARLYPEDSDVDFSPPQDYIIRNRSRHHNQRNGREDQGDFRRTLNEVQRAHREEIERIREERGDYD